MALTPHEEREIHQIEESLSGSDPGFAARMSGRLPVRRRLVLGGLCLVVVAGAFAFADHSAWVVSVVGAAVAAFFAGWCFGRTGPLDLRGATSRLLSRWAQAVGAAWRAARGAVSAAVRRPVRRWRRTE